MYKNGNVIFIDKEGKRAIPEVYKSLVFIDSQRAYVRTSSRKEGIIDLSTHQLLIDTVFESISLYNCGAAIVYEYTSPSEEYVRLRVGVIDTAGKFVVPFGVYSEIIAFYDKYAIVRTFKKGKRDEGKEGVIDVTGRLLYSKSYRGFGYIGDNYHEGLAIINIYRKKKGRSVSGKDYQGFINVYGELVLNDTNYVAACDFSNGRAFMKKDNGEYIIIDRSFKQVGKESYEDILRRRFSNGLAIVKTPDGYGIIDTTGNFRSRFRYYDIDGIGIVDDYFFFAADKGNGTKLYGIADVDGNVICKPVMESFSRKGFENGLLRATIDRRLAYVNRNGEIVYHQPKDTGLPLTYLNIDYMNRGYFYAYSSMGSPGTGHGGGWAASSNKPKKLTEPTFSAIQPEMIIDTTLSDTFATSYYGYSLFVRNSTRDTITFNAQDSRLYLKLQAQDSQGEWKDIEYLPSSWCGNSYHTIDLEPGAYWRFTIPHYQGEINTKIRAELKYVNRMDPKKDKVIYSNEINGSVNPAQFWNKRSYTPQGIMDSYFE